MAEDGIEVEVRIVDGNPVWRRVELTTRIILRARTFFASALTDGPRSS